MHVVHMMHVMHMMHVVHMMNEPDFSLEGSARRISPHGGASSMFSGTAPGGVRLEHKTFRGLGRSEKNRLLAWSYVHSHVRPLP